MKNCKVYVWKETFAVMKSKRAYPNAFVNIVDRNEITVIVDQSKVNEDDVIEIEKGWRVLTFNTVLPFGLVGFLAKVSQALANKKISILAISTYSTDHILVKEKDLKKTIKTLESLGCIVKFVRVTLT